MSPVFCVTFFKKQNKTKQAMQIYLFFYHNFSFFQKIILGVKSTSLLTTHEKENRHGIL